MTLSAALFAFTVTFRPELQTIVWSKAMWVGWGGLAISMVGGMVHMHGWDRFYISYRDFAHRHPDGIVTETQKKEGKRKRDAINLWRRIGMACQFAGFAVGVAGVALFAAVNVDGKHAPVVAMPKAAQLGPAAAAASSAAALPDASNP
jgi:hypothetical protein